MFKAIIIEPDKTVREVELEGLADMQAAVKGLIEPVDLKDGVTMYVNEEGNYQFGPTDVNWVACDVAGLGGRPDFMLVSPILGPVVLVGFDPASGETVDLPEKGRRWVQRVGREAGATWVEGVRAND